MKEEVVFLTGYNKTQELLHNSAIVSLKEKVATTLQHMELLQYNHITPLND